MPCPSMWPKQFWLVQNGFGLTRLIWTWPWWFGHDQNELVTTKLSKVQIVIFYQNESQFGPDQFILFVTISLWLWPNHYGQVQINLVRPKPFWTDQNCFDHIEGQGISVHFKSAFPRTSLYHIFLHKLWKYGTLLVIFLHELTQCELSNSDLLKILIHK